MYESQNLVKVGEISVRESMGQFRSWRLEIGMARSEAEK